MLYILSLRKLSNAPAHGCVLELEDVVSEVTGATIISPSRGENVSALLRNFPLRDADLFVAAITFYDAREILEQIRDWRKIFRKIFLYIFDAFLLENERTIGKIKRRVSRYINSMGKIDHLFIPIRGEIDALSRHFNIPVSYVPLAADVVKFGSAQISRGIDVNAYGRQHTQHVDVLSELYNKNGSGRSLYFTSHISIERVNNLYQHRAFFWKMLSISRIALAYDPVRVNPSKRFFPCSFVGQRWFESIAAGCVVVGYKPNCEETGELLFWEDATIECPEDPDQFVVFIEDLLLDHARMSRVRTTNYLQMLANHDWCFRVETMLKTMALGVDRSGFDRRYGRMEQLAVIVRQSSER